MKRSYLDPITIVAGGTGKDHIITLRIPHSILSMAQEKDIANPLYMDRCGLPVPVPDGLLVRIHLPALL